MVCSGVHVTNLCYYREIGMTYMDYIYMAGSEFRFTHVGLSLNYTGRCLVFGITFVIPTKDMFCQMPY